MGNSDGSSLALIQADREEAVERLIWKGKVGPLHENSLT